MKPIYGVDLGTTYSKCAIVGPQDGIVRVFKLDRSTRDSPQNTLDVLRSAVTVGMLEERRVAYVGATSLDVYLEADETAPMKRFDEAKIFIGVDTSKTVGVKPPWPFPPHNWGYRPEDIGAIVLLKIKKEVEAAFGPPMERIVITHPQHFTDTQRRATRQAAEIAGLEVVATLTEPDAAALAFGVEAEPGIYMVFDLGGGTLDVTVCRIEPGKLHVLSSDGLKMGGRDFDRVIFARMVEEYKVTYPDFDPRIHLDERTEQIWYNHAERTKRMAGSQESVAIKYQCKNEDFEGSPKRIVVKRDEFLAGSAEIVRQCVECANSTREQAKLGWKDFAGILLVGGSTRMPHLRRALEEAVGQSLPPADVDVDTPIARGAAILGYNLVTKGPAIASASSTGVPLPAPVGADSAKIELVGSLARGLGVMARSLKTQKDVIATLIPKGTSIPCKRNRIFRTFEAYKPSIEVVLYEGDALNSEKANVEPDDCFRIGRVEISGFKPGPAAQPVEVTIEIENNGTKHLIVSAAGRQQEAVIEYNPNAVVATSEIEKRRAFVASLDIV